ncbi:hypothetical protein H8356DRAFT_1355390 [Neocallimastix lanati (nom. inval.)]|nr:hypothetical protein H8356DRAFT_1355390 [Neocallimastix sp. JGI-2020a]
MISAIPDDRGVGGMTSVRVFYFKSLLEVVEQIMLENGVVTTKLTIPNFVELKALLFFIERAVLADVQYMKKLNLMMGNKDNYSTSSTVPYFVGIAEFLTNIDDEMSVDVEMIRLFKRWESFYSY